MPNRYVKSDTLLFVRNASLRMKKMEKELDEHRYFLERNVARETESLQKRIALLESCNAVLSDRLARAHKELAARKRDPAQILPLNDAKSKERALKWHVMSNRAHQQAGSDAQDKWGQHVAA